MDHQPPMRVRSNIRPLQYSNELVSSVMPLIDEGESANAVPYSHKLCSRVPHIRGNRRLQLPRSAMRKSRPGGTALLITVSSEPGKYAWMSLILHPQNSVPSLQLVLSFNTKKISFLKPKIFNGKKDHTFENEWQKFCVLYNEWSFIIERLKALRSSVLVSSFCNMLMI